MSDEGRPVVAGESSGCRDRIKRVSNRSRELEWAPENQWCRGWFQPEIESNLVISGVACSNADQTCSSEAGVGLVRPCAVTGWPRVDSHVADALRHKPFRSRRKSNQLPPRVTSMSLSFWAPTLSGWSCPRTRRWSAISDSYAPMACSILPTSASHRAMLFRV